MLCARKEWNSKLMKKKVFGRKLSRNTNSRKALFRSLMRGLILNGEIKTTKPKAKAIVPMADKLMLLAKKGDLNARREALSILANDRDLVAKLFKDYEAFSKSKTSGFTRIIEATPRRGDNASMALISWANDNLSSKKEDNEKKVTKKVKESKLVKKTEKKVVKKEK